MRGLESDPLYEMRIIEVLLFKELHISPSELDHMSSKQIAQYLVIIDEIHTMEREQMEAQK